MRKFIVFAILVFVLMFIGYVAYGHKTRFQHVTNIDSRGKTIIAFGDSITRGAGLEGETSYSVRISRELGLPVRNAGRDGDTTNSALERIEADVLSHDPWIVIVFLGGNDFLKKTPGSVLRQNLSQIIEKIYERGGMVVLVGINTVIVTENYADIYEEISTKYHTAYVPNILSGIIGHDDLMADPIHPNGKGHGVIAERILNVLEPLIKETERYR